MSSVSSCTKWYILANCKSLKFCRPVETYTEIPQYNKHHYDNGQEHNAGDVRRVAGGHHDRALGLLARRLHAARALVRLAHDARELGDALARVAVEALHALPAVLARTGGALLVVVLARLAGEGRRTLALRLPLARAAFVVARGVVLAQEEAGRVGAADFIWAIENLMSSVIWLYQKSRSVDSTRCRRNRKSL